MDVAYQYCLDEQLTEVTREGNKNHLLQYQKYLIEDVGLLSFF